MEETTATGDLSGNIVWSLKYQRPPTLAECKKKREKDKQVSDSMLLVAGHLYSKMPWSQ